jgi:hypothetical protein
MHLLMEHKSGRPTLSVVAVTRNDNHGGDLRARMQQFVGGFIEQCKRHHLNAELILVEWNPPAGQPPLEHALSWPDDFGPATVRIATVPASLHAKFDHAASLPLFQMIGKNVGIRRAQGHYVLATNVDVLFNDALTCYLRDRLEPRVVLRVDRYDVPRDLAAKAPFDEVMADCSRRFFQVNMRLGTYDAIALRMTTGRPGVLTALQGIVYGARVFGIFGIAHRAVRAGTIRAAVDRSKLLAASAFKKIAAFRPGHSMRRGLELLAGRLQRLTVSMFKNLAVLLENLVVGTRRTVRIFVFAARVGLRKKSANRTPIAISILLLRVCSRATRSILLGLGKAAHKRIDRSLTGCIHYLKRSKAAAILRRTGAVWSLFAPKSAVERRFQRSRWLHTNACGDFTLLSREDWFQLRGYPEWPIFSWHLDSVFMFAANAQGIRELTLGSRYRVYHIDHDSGWSLSGAQELFDRLRGKGIRYIDNAEVQRLQILYAKNPSAAIVNDADWGLADHALPERKILPVPERSHVAFA